MAFNLSSLLRPKALPRQSTLDDIFLENATEVIVSKLPLAVEFVTLHQSLQKSFSRLTPGVVVNLQDLLFITPQSTQECRISFSRAIDATLAETTINHALNKEFDRVGLLFDRRAVHLVMANI
jgi:hypothetical protein